MKSGYVVLIAALAVAASGCRSKQNSSSDAAIRAAIEAHVRQDPHIRQGDFNTQIEHTKVDGQTATALVRFQSKQSPQLAVLVRYVLDKNENGWKVVSSSAVSAQGVASHPSMMPSAAGSAPQSKPTIPPPVSSH